ncbi:MAG: neutral zinc metallopeptidase [Pseudoflavonifractor sp.]|nr:neutral zinc metallopeptidase [Alloprevotella sp.]MCM1116470.1 neutral zinc metallopeptidase [Pseudoflavonifractor sp.]
MRLDGRRSSSNVDDRRGRSAFSGRGGKIAGGGIAGVIIAVVIALLGGGDLSSILSGVIGNGGLSPLSTEQSTYTPTAEDEELATFAKQILAGTEDVWTEIFRQNGLEYEAPTLVLFDGATSSACGTASEQTGPFYCSADQSVYLDLAFFRNMRQSLGADGDFAYAYVIAHEVGHHVQYLLGTLSDAHTKMQRLSEAEANKISVRLELQADFYAGVWAHHDNKRFRSLEPGDIDEALDAARKIGDDYLQKKARGYAVPETFNHGTSEQRHRWLNLGLTTGDPSRGDTFTPAYSGL